MNRKALASNGEGGGGGGGGIARWLYAGLAVLLNAASWVPSSSGEIFFR